MAYGRDGGGLKGIMILAMVFVFGAAAYLSARDLEAELCRPFPQNINVIRRVGDVQTCAFALVPSLRERRLVLRVKGGAGAGLLRIERTEHVVTRAYLSSTDHPEPELVLGADPMVPTSFIQTR